MPNKDENHCYDAERLAFRGSRMRLASAASAVVSIGLLSST